MELLQIVFLCTAVALLIYGMDDFLMDVYYWLRMAYRMVVYRRMPPLRLETLNARSEQRVALMIPCWQENNVLGGMLSNTMNRLQYENYDVFIGVYPNDVATREALTPSLKKSSRIHEVVGPIAGPTTKAQNLNAIYAGIREYEQKMGVVFDIFVIHDAEDVIHPLSFKLFNYLLPVKDMVQVPVFPIQVKLSSFTPWTYASEFAENHTKDMIGRDWMGGFVPSAGVGTAFSKRAIDILHHDNEMLFNPETLTEDYAFSLDLNRHGLTGIFVQQSVKRLISRPRFFWFGSPVPTETKEWIATRALFPTTYSNAIRQKSRWVLGIALQEWKATGWSGNKATRYSLLRDRKAPLGYLLLMAGYALLAYGIFYQVSFWWTGHAIVPALQPLDQTLVFLVTAMMIHRFLQRAIAVWRIYGFGPALLSVPITFYLNIINIHAFLRAFSLFIKSDLKNEPVPWAKTTNHFPSVNQLRAFQMRLGDVLIESSAITSNELVLALKAQLKTKTPLGQILVGEGTITEDQLQTSLSRLGLMGSNLQYPVLDEKVGQHKLNTGDLTPV